MTIYKQVPIEEEPNKCGWYLCHNKTENISMATAFYFNGKEFSNMPFKEDMFWICEITLPTEEEINKAAESHYALAENGFIKGAEYILNLLK